jgi:hypothetical protein
MKTAAEYRAMADEMFQMGARSASGRSTCILAAARPGLADAATKLDGLFLTQTKSAPDELSKTTRSAD